MVIHFFQCYFWNAWHSDGSMVVGVFYYGWEPVILGMPIYSCRRKNKNILFLHVPKCGGGSVEKFFRDNGFIEELRCIDHRLRSYRCSPQHWHAELLAPLINVDSFDYIFSVVRNPIHRLVSEYKWKVAHPWASAGIDDWYIRCRDAYKENQYIFDNHFRPQVEFLLPSAKVFLLENGLQFFVETISASLGIEFDISVISNQKDCAHDRRTDGNPELSRRLIDCCPSEKTRRLIYKDYRKDFEFLDGFKKSSILDF